MTPDEKALEAVRTPGFDRWDNYTQYAVDAFLAPLSTREVLTLMLTSDAPDTYSPAEWGLMVEQRREAAEARRAVAKKEEREREAGAARRRLAAPDLDPIPGYHVVPDAALKRSAKDRRKVSLKAAAERREKRKELGTVLVPDPKTFNAMTKSEKIELRHRQEKFALTHDHMQEMLADMLEGPEVDQVGFLYRNGRAPRLNNSHLAATSAWIERGGW